MLEVSVTVSVVGAPTRRVPCRTCDLVGDRCWDQCDGTEEISIAPSTNWSNGNAREVLELLGLGRRAWGAIEPGEVSGVLRRVNGILARGAEKGLARAPRSHGGARRVITNSDGLPEITTTCQVIDCGSPAGSWTYRFERLREVLSWAATNGCGVSWG